MVHRSLLLLRLLCYVGSFFPSVENFDKKSTEFSNNISFTRVNLKDQIIGAINIADIILYFDTASLHKFLTGKCAIIIPLIN